MSRLQLSLAVGEYDHVRDVTTGEVQPQGIDLICTHGAIENLLYRAHNHAEWDVSEVGFGAYASRLSRSEQPYVAIPVFTSRVFRHTAVYVREGSGIHAPRDLEGKRVGMPEWGMAAAIWIRGALMEEYGLDARAVDWVQAGLRTPGRIDRMPPRASLGIPYGSRPDRSLDAMLAEGSVDAVISARAPQAFADGSGAVRRLFADAEAVEMAYFERTRFVPIMHFLAIRREVYEADRWVAMELFKAFSVAKDRSVTRANDITASYFPVPLHHHRSDDAMRVLRGDAWPYGVEPNRACLDTFLRYADEQGVTERRLTVDELFVPELARIPAV